MVTYNLLRQRGLLNGDENERLRELSRKISPSPDSWKYWQVQVIIHNHAFHLALIRLFYKLDSLTTLSETQWWHGHVQPRLFSRFISWGMELRFIRSCPRQHWAFSLHLFSSLLGLPEFALPALFHIQALVLSSILYSACQMKWRWPI